MDEEGARDRFFLSIHHAVLSERGVASGGGLCPRGSLIANPSSGRAPLTEHPESTKAPGV